MEDLVVYTTKLAEGLKPLGQLLPFKPILDYTGRCIKRLIEPNLVRYEQLHADKTLQMEMEKYPMRRVEVCLQLLKEHPELVTPAIGEAFQNAMNIGQMAIGYIKGDPKASNISQELIDDEWMNRFIDEAKYISDQRLQQIWARLLKEKVFNPQDVNKRVLRIIKDMDAEELNLVSQNMCYFISGFIPLKILGKLGNMSSKILQLQNLGLVLTGKIEWSIKESDYEEENGNSFFVLDGKGYQYKFIGPKENLPFTVECAPLTKEGEVIWNIVEAKMTKESAELFLDFFKRKANKDVEVTMQEL